MYVNNINLTEKYGAMLITKDIQNSEVTNYNDWLDNAIGPIRIKEEKFKFSKITVTLLIEGTDEEDVLTKISNILDLCKSGILKFQDIDYYYNISLANSANKKIICKVYELTLEYQSSYKYSEEVTETINRVITKTITANGNTITPAIIEITPSVTIIDLELTINGEAITIKNLTASKKTILNGEDDTVTELGINKFADTDLWEFPRLKPGINVITVNRSNCDITIRYKPRYI